MRLWLLASRNDESINSGTNIKFERDVQLLGARALDLGRHENEQTVGRLGFWHDGLCA